MFQTHLKNKIIAFTFIILLIVLLPSTVIAQAEKNVILNYIQSKPVKGKFAYDVSVYFTLLDSSGNTIKDLNIEDISLSEDGQRITPDSLALVNDEPIYLSLLLDTSGSMIGEKIEAAKKAAISFTSGLNSEDKLSITTFNNVTELLSDFTTEHTAIKDNVNKVKAEPNSGTCLFDAAYEAVQRTAALPQGRRAVILLTDGKDELLTGGTCSKLALDDVIDLATEGNIRVPVYTIGIGNKIDEAVLQRLSELTGGQFEKTPDAAQLEELFKRLLNQLQSQFILHYTSTGYPGSHNLVLQVSYLNTNLTDSRGFMLPALPLNISIIAPTSGQEIVGKIKIVTAITGQGEPIKEVVFKANGVTIGTDSTAPYEMEWIPDLEMSGTADIQVVVLGSDDQNLAEASTQVIISQTISLSTPEIEESSIFTLRNFLIFGGILIVIIIGMTVYLLMTGKKRKEEKRREKLWHDNVVNPTERPTLSNDLTIDGFIPSPNSLGVLTILQSDDPAMLGQRFEIMENSIRLGRLADNDIPFPKDSPVSKHHAIIENRNGQLFLSEQVSTLEDGTVKTPTFGTYVNEQRITQPIVLKNKDQIRLGKRVLLQFETFQMDVDVDASTIDQIDNHDQDSTIDE